MLYASRLKDVPSPKKEKLSFFAFLKGKATDKFGGVKKFQFLVILIICTGTLCFQAAKCVEKYMDRNTGTADKYVHVSKTSFPVMTVCSTYPYKLERLQSHGMSIKRDIQFGANWVSNDSNVSPSEFYDDVVLKVEEIVLSVKIYAEVLIEGKNVFTLGINNNCSICA